jgi:putative hydrolase of the HAD superfamily
MIKTILFDVDGVLVRGEPFSYYLERDYGISREKTRAFFKTIFPDCLIGNADLKQELIAHLQQWGWHKPVDEFLQYWFVSEHNIDEALVEHVQQLRQQGIPCYLATNQERYRTAYILEQMGFADKFDGIFSSAHIGYMKPQAAFFEQVIRELGNISTHDILFWDDSPGNIAAAREVGLQAELYTNFADFQQ